MKERTSFEIIISHLPPTLRKHFERLEPRSASTLTEVRLYVDRPVALIYPDRVQFLTSSGLTGGACNVSCIECSRGDIDSVIDNITHYSFHTHISELKNGCIMLSGGVRAAISGSYNQEGLITGVTGVSFRVSRCVKDCARELVPLLADSGGILIAGGVNSGKTTILRDLCRLIGSENKTVLIDERNEIACTVDGHIYNDVGALTNVLANCSRSKGIVTAVRNLSPRYIFCDEIASDDDIDALMCGRGCGVDFCATVHANDMNDLLRRSFADRLISSGIFRYAVFLAGAAAPSEISEIRRLENDDTSCDISRTDYSWRSSRIRAFGQAQE